MKFRITAIIVLRRGGTAGSGNSQKTIPQHSVSF